MIQLLRRAGLLNHREARELERSSVSVSMVKVFYAGLLVIALVLAALLIGFASGLYYVSSMGERPVPQETPAECPPTASVVPEVHEAYQARMDRLLRELEELNDQQAKLEAKLLNKSTEAAEAASQAQLLRAQLRLKEREIEALSAARASSYERGRKLVRGQTRYLPARKEEDEPPGFFASEEPQVKPAMASSESPAEIYIDLNPPDARPGNPYRLRLEIHNRGNASIDVTELEVVWSYSGRNTGGPLAFSRRVVGPRSTSVLYEVEGVWIEELTEGTIIATATLEGGDQLVNTLRWNEG